MFGEIFSFELSCNSFSHGYPLWHYPIYLTLGLGNAIFYHMVHHSLRELFHLVDTTAEGASTRRMIVRGLLWNQVFCDKMVKHDWCGRSCEKYSWWQMLTRCVMSCFGKRNISCAVFFHFAKVRITHVVVDAPFLPKALYYLTNAITWLLINWWQRMKFYYFIQLVTKNEILLFHPLPHISAILTFLSIPWKKNITTGDCTACINSVWSIVQSGDGVSL